MVFMMSESVEITISLFKIVPLRNFDFAFLAIFRNPTRLYRMAAIHEQNGLETKGIHYEV